LKGMLRSVVVLRGSVAEQQACRIGASVVIRKRNIKQDSERNEVKNAPPNE